MFYHIPSPALPGEEEPTWYYLWELDSQEVLEYEILGQITHDEDWVVESVGSDSELAEDLSDVDMDSTEELIDPAKLYKPVSIGKDLRFLMSPGTSNPFFSPRSLDDDVRSVRQRCRAAVHQLFKPVLENSGINHNMHASTSCYY